MSYIEFKNSQNTVLKLEEITFCKKNYFPEDDDYWIDTNIMSMYYDDRRLADREYKKLKNALLKKGKKNVESN